MANTADNVRVGVTGAVYYAATTQALPTTLTAATTGFTDVGYVGEDGITKSEPEDTNPVKAWQNGATVRTIKSSHEVTYAFDLLESSTAVYTLIYGSAPGAGTALKIDGADRDHHAFVIDVVDGTEKLRYCIPDGQITELGDVVHANGEPIAYPITITCYPDTSGNKVYVYKGATA